MHLCILHIQLSSLIIHVTLHHYLCEIVCHHWGENIGKVGGPTGRIVLGGTKVLKSGRTRHIFGPQGQKSGPAVARPAMEPCIVATIQGSIAQPSSFCRLCLPLIRHFVGKMLPATSVLDWSLPSPPLCERRYCVARRHAVTRVCLCVR